MMHPPVVAIFEFIEMISKEEGEQFLKSYRAKELNLLREELNDAIDRAIRNLQPEPTGFF